MTSIQNKKKSIPNEDIKRFQKKIFSFYTKNKRDLPWRKTTDPYKILLSELMLQQTQVTRVIQYYTRWIKKWPTINALSSASLSEVLQMWMGLGYNRRAVNLYKTARIIVIKFHSDVIEAMQHYKDLPGIGRYTSQAVQIFSTNANLVTVDTNIRRILINEFHLPQTISDADLWNLATTCLPIDRSRDWHNALMDYGALYLTAQKSGIKSKSQQSTFEGSDRQIRGKILRSLLQKPMALSELVTTFNLEPERLAPILKKMIQEKIIQEKNTTYHVYE
jgi:A/G-specific adenine glycosylase